MSKRKIKKQSLSPFSFDKKYFKLIKKNKDHLKFLDVNFVELEQLKKKIYSIIQ